MKIQLLAFIGMGLLLATASAYAQTGVMKARVPFNFIVDQTDFPAGEYVIQGFGMNGVAVTINSADRKLVKAVLSNSCEAAQSQKVSKLVFHRYGGQYFLGQIWMKGSDRGKELLKTRREREIAMDHQFQNVVVVASLR
jgi:hypothetical protein